MRLHRTLFPLFAAFCSFVLALAWAAMTPASCFGEDKRPHVVFAIHEDEYHADKSLPPFAKFLADRHGYRCTILLGDGDRGIPGLEALKTADVLVVYVRRKALPKEQMAMLHAYLDAGKPLIGLRTASHAFSIKKPSPPGMEQWETFDGDVLGGNYHGHGPNPVGTDVSVAPGAGDHPILEGVPRDPWHSTGSLYYASPIDPNAKVLLNGSAKEKGKDRVEPIAWTRTYKGARVFYTSLGHVDDFQQPQFERLLVNAVRWAVGR